MHKGLDKAIKHISTVLVILAVILAVLLVGVRLVGFQVYAVLSSSMEPTYHTGALLYVREADPAEIQAGTPITFMLSADTVATHRVVEVVEDKDDPSVRWFVTKGDANDTEDGAPVHQNNVLGVPAFSIPGLGYLAHFIQNPPGKYIAIAVCAFIVLLAILPDLFRSEEEKPQKGREEGKPKD